MYHTYYHIVILYDTIFCEQYRTILRYHTKNIWNKSIVIIFADGAVFVVRVGGGMEKGGGGL